MKCPHCGKEIANESQYCEFCGMKLSSTTSRVNGSLVAWIMFLLVICFSAAELSCIECLNCQEMEYAQYVAHCTILNSFLLIAFVNVCVFIISIVLAKKNQLRKSTSIALCLMSAFIAIGAITCALTMEVGVLPYRTEAEGTVINDGLMYGAIALSAVVAGLYAIYWLIAKMMHINF